MRQSQPELTACVGRGCRFRVPPALCARLSDLRRQVRVVEKQIASVEAELDRVMVEAGEAPLETPAGTLRRVVEDGGRKFVLEV